MTPEYRSDVRLAFLSWRVPSSFVAARVNLSTATVSPAWRTTKVPLSVAVCPFRQAGTTTRSRIQRTRSKRNLVTSALGEGDTENIKSGTSGGNLMPVPGLLQASVGTHASMPTANGASPGPAIDPFFDRCSSFGHQSGSRGAVRNGAGSGVEYSAPAHSSSRGGGPVGRAALVCNRDLVSGAGLTAVGAPNSGPRQVGHCGGSRQYCPATCDHSGVQSAAPSQGRSGRPRARAA